MRKTLRKIPRGLYLILPLALAACTSAPRYRPLPQEIEPPPSLGKQAVELAKTYIGTPYRAGGTTKAGVDCSGLVVSVFEELGLALPRTSRDQAAFGVEVSRSELRPGDLVFFRTEGGTRVTHVGIYSGRGRFIHASTRLREVRMDALEDNYFRKRFVVARRVL